MKLLRRGAFGAVSWLVGTSVLVGACGAGEGGEDGPSGSGGAGQDGGSGGGSVDGGDDGPVCLGANCENPDPEAVCGNAALEDGEACDDGNTAGGDGCSADCGAVEEGFICPFPGQECRPFVRCGDGIVSFPEQCDDGNLEPLDGCSPACRLERGFKCEGSPSTCTTTVCGDSVVEGTESCDDGNTVPFDGCDDLCQTEPNCGASGCTSECGDGLVLGDEECDDGNTVSGDGCSSTCRVEKGSVCSSEPCERVGEQCVLRIPVIYRDFNAGGDFQPGCHSEVEITGIVQANLGSNGKPVLSDPLPGNTCISNFGEWYEDVPGKNARIVSHIVLFQKEDGGYVNRWKDDGTQFVSKTGQAKDGSPFFFPIDDSPLALTPLNQRYTATVGQEYSDVGGYTNESDWVSPAPVHNFHFTSQVQHWFRYDEAEVASLAFTGDDDVWVFVNGRLAVDLGGLHVPRSGSVSISSATAATYGLEHGKVYPINIFHAERKRDGSSFRLTLSGLTMSRSVCTSYCGDSIIGPDEECDDGENLGGYNRCQPGCKLGGYCGDGIQQEEEQCDYRDPAAPSECTTGCRFEVVR